MRNKKVNEQPAKDKKSLTKDFSGQNQLKALENTENEQILGAPNAILAALKQRPRALRRLWIAEGRRGGGQIDEIFALAQSAGANIKKVPRKILDGHYGSAEHQGLVAIFDAHDYQSLDDLLASVPPEGPSLILALDKISDPRNLGALMRTAVSFGAAGLIISKEHSAALTPAAMSAATGAAEYLSLTRVTNLRMSLEELKKYGFWLVAAEADGDENLFNFKFPQRTVVVLGSEGKGLSPLIYKICDFKVHIPMANSGLTSLNVSASGAIFSFEYLRQQKNSV